jgi:hypothetical protein
MNEQPFPNKEESIDSIEAKRAETALVSQEKADQKQKQEAEQKTEHEAPPPKDLLAAAKLFHRYGNVGKDAEELLRHKPRPDELAAASAAAIQNGVPKDVVKTAYILFMEASKVPAQEAGELFENAMRGIELPSRSTTAKPHAEPHAPRAIHSTVTPTQVHYTCPECKAQHTLTKEGLQSEVVACACGCEVRLSL